MKPTVGRIVHYVSYGTPGGVITPMQQYAVDMICDGAESTAEDDLNEEGTLDGGDHEAAVDLAHAVIRGARANPDALLALAVFAPTDENAEDDE